MALEYASSPDKEKKKKVGGKKKIVIVDTEHLAESEARDTADAKMTANAESMKGVSGFFKRIWKHGIARDYYHQKEIVDAKKAIYENENIYAGVDTDKAYHDDAMEAIVSRFTHEYADEVVSRGAGEKIKTLDKYDQATKELNTTLQELVREYAGGSMTEGAFRESKKRIVREIADTYPGSIDIGKMFADNIFDIAKEAKDAVDHGIKINELDLDFEIVLGKAKSSIRSEAKFTTADTIMQRLKEKAPLLSSALLNETSIASLVAIGVGVGSSLLRSKVASWVTFGGSALVASALSGLRESKKVKEDRRQHGRERAKGQTFEAGAKQREQMEQSQYEMINATKVTKDIEALFYTKNNEGEDVVRALTEDEEQQLVGMIVDLEARAVLAEQRKIDLISYSDTRNVENERTALDLLRAKVKAQFRRQQGKSEFDAFLKSVTDTETRRLLGGETGIEAKDKIFNKLKAKKVGLAMGRTLLAGVAIGGIAQEILSIGGDKVQGVGEGVAGMFTAEDTVTTAETAHLTPLEKLRQVITGDDIRMGSELYTTEIAGNPVKAPEGIEFVGQADGSVDITRYGETIADDVKLNFNPDGTLAPESIDMLQSEYNIVAQSCIDAITTEEVVSHTPGEHVALHGEDMQQVSRNMWYDNNTPKPVFDLNELKLWWGGENNVGLDANGNYIFTVEHMNSSGSFHESFSVDAQEKIANGGLKMIFSLSEDTQNYVYQVPIDINGHAIIDPNSEIGKIFFKEVNGHVVFLGKFAEVAESLGEQKGVESVNLLATHVGEGLDAIAGPESVTKDVPVTIFDVPADDTVDWPPFIPVVGRRPLEPMVPGQAKKPESKPIQPIAEHIPGYGYNEKLKKHFSNIYEYRNSNKEANLLATKLLMDPVLKKKYWHVLKRLDTLKSSKQLSLDEKKKLQNELDNFNKRYQSNPPLVLEEYVSLQIRRTYSQIENIFVEETKVGEKTFGSDFYKEAPMVKGLERAKEVVVILDDPIGDAVLMLPILHALDKYMENNSRKPIKVITLHPELFKALEQQFNNRITIISKKEFGANFLDDKDRFIINTNKNFEDYKILNMSAEKAADPSYVFSVDWASWQKEEYPERSGYTTKYDPIPARVARNMEVMLGQKLFADIKGTKKYIETGPTFEEESKEIKAKYDIADNAEIFVISPGSSVVPKEYEPQKWYQVLTGIYKKYPNAHILFLEDPNTEKREKYGKMVDQFKKDTGHAISRANEKLNKTNTLMSMAKYVITPDTGLGHYAGALGKPAVMLYLSDPVLWSTPGARRLIHKKARDVYRLGSGSYSRAWDMDRRNQYYVDDNGVLVGASDINPNEIINALEK